MSINMSCLLHGRRSLNRIVNRLDFGIGVSMIGFQHGKKKKKNPDTIRTCLQDRHISCNQVVCEDAQNNAMSSVNIHVVLRRNNFSFLTGAVNTYTFNTWEINDTQTAGHASGQCYQLNRTLLICMRLLMTS